MRSFVLFFLLFLPSGVALAGGPWLAAVRLFVKESPELSFLKSEAERLGVHAYLAGGSAASLAFHLRDGANQKEHGHEFRSVFSRMQDLDVLIDGTPEQAAELEKSMQAKFPYYLTGGKKGVWEVNPVAADKGVKIARLDNADFLQQNNDSLSLAALEVTDPPRGSPRVRDLRSWDAEAKDFVESVDERKIRFYREPGHRETRFFREGRNPEVLSVVRVLQKALRHDLAIDPADEAAMREIVQAEGTTPLENGYVKNWLAHNGKKLYLNSRDVERSAREVNALGLKPLLAAAGGDAAKAGTLAWLAEREPLRGFAVGRGRGQTAAELGLTQPLFHFTTDELAYENLSRGAPDYANAFRSRGGAAGEMAAMGEGFYLARSRDSIWAGKKGAFAVPYSLRPEAREGKDFVLQGTDEKGALVLLNRNAVRTGAVDPDPWGHLGIFEVLEHLRTAPDAAAAARFASAESRLDQEIRQLSSAEKKKLIAYVEQRFDRGIDFGWDPQPASFHLSPDIDFLLRLPVSNEDPQLNWVLRNYMARHTDFSLYAQRYSPWYDGRAVRTILRDAFRDFQYSENAFDASATAVRMVVATLKEPPAKDRLDIVLEMMRNFPDSKLHSVLLPRVVGGFPLESSDLVELHHSVRPAGVLPRPGNQNLLYRHRNYPDAERAMEDLLRELALTGRADPKSFVGYGLPRFFTTTQARRSPDLFRYYLAHAEISDQLLWISRALHDPAWARESPDVMLYLASFSNGPDWTKALEQVLERPYWRDHPTFTPFLKTCKLPSRMACLRARGKDLIEATRAAWDAEVASRKALLAKGVENVFMKPQDEMRLTAFAEKRGAASLDPAGLRPAFQQTPPEQTYKPARFEEGGEVSLRFEGRELVLTHPPGATDVKLNKVDGRKDAVDCQFLYQGLNFRLQIPLPPRPGVG